jgi:hypothetical protein
MQNDLSAPGNGPTRGFASIIKLVSDISSDLEAMEKAVPEPQPVVEPPRPQPVRIRPAPAAPPQAPTPVFTSAIAAPEESSSGVPWWVYALVGIGLLRVCASLGS